MGRGGTDSLWSSGMTCCHVAFGGGTTNLEEVVSGDAHQRGSCVVSGTTLISQPVCCLAPFRSTPFGGGIRVSAEALTLIAKHTCYRIKPYGQLVSVSLTHYCASTPDLSTSWS